MMRINSVYPLTEKDVDDVLAALHGDGLPEDRRNEMVESLNKWKRKLSIQLKTYELTKKWLEDYGREIRVQDRPYEYEETPENKLLDWVHYQLEYMGGVEWSDDFKEVVINKYASWKTLLEDAARERMLQFLTEEITKHVSTID